MKDKHFSKLLKNISEELKAANPNPKQKPNLQEESTPEKIAQYLSTSQKMDSSVSSKSDDLIKNNTARDKIPSEPSNIEKQRWDDPLRRNENEKFVTVKELNDHYSLFLSRIQQQMSTMSGGGEVRLSRLDDVDSSTIGPGKHLAYNPTTKKFFFETVTSNDTVVDGTTIDLNANGALEVLNLPNTDLGPIQAMLFDTDHDSDLHEHTVGTISWDADDDTLKIYHSGGVTQQLGEELYVRVRNESGQPILNGTCVRFDGVETNGSNFMRIAPFLADGSFPSLYGLGVTTEDIPNGSLGRITVWGKVRNINTTGIPVSETWNRGDILYTNPISSGLFTNVKPTSPQNVFPIATVLTVSETTGEIFVRPTPTIKQNYGKFSINSEITIPSINTPYVFNFEETLIANGVVLAPGFNSRITTDQSGLYSVDINTQIDASGGGFSGGVIYIWLRINGVDVPRSTRRQGIASGLPVTAFVTNYTVSLMPDDYLEIMYATTNTGIFFDAFAATAFSPATSSVHVSVTQIQQ